MTNSNYIAVVSWDNYEIISQRLVFGVKEKHKNWIEKTSPEDRILFYIKAGHFRSVKMHSSISQPYEVLSEVFLDEQRIFKSESDAQDYLYPYRIRIRPLYKKQEPKAFKQLVDKVDFISNKKRWGITFMGRSLIEISNHDYQAITDYLEQCTEF